MVMIRSPAPPGEALGGQEEGDGGFLWSSSTVRVMPTTSSLSSSG